VIEDPTGESMGNQLVSTNLPIDTQPTGPVRRCTKSPSATGPKAEDEWPERLDAGFAALLFDSRWIAYLDGQPLDRVRAWQQRRLTQLITHAARNSTWWADRLSVSRERHGRTLTDLPILEREGYREAIKVAGGALRLPPEHGSAHKYVTSGSTGIPVAFYFSALSARLLQAEWYYDDLRQGREPGLLRAEVAARVPEHSGFCEVIKGTPLLGTSDTLRRRLQISSLEEHARWITEVRPAYLSMNPTAFEGVLDVYASGSVEPPHIAQIVTFGETVDTSLRRRARDILGASIRDRYSCEEIGVIGFQCPSSDDHYHLALTNVIVEILDDHGRPSPSDAIGRVVVTGLHNYASPVIRYELNDLAAWQPRCVCGRAAPVLTRLLGRKRFLVRLPSGERQAPRVTGKEWLEIAPVREHRLVQVSEGVLVAELVLDRPLSPHERNAVVAMLRKEISPDLTYEVRQVEHIEWAPTYKRQDFVSLV
jgi:phenylacetate-CoA ligase